VPHWIGGIRTAGSGARTAPVYDPATGTVARQVTLADQSDVDNAVATAVKAAADWGESSLSQRTRVLFAFRALVDAHRDELARIITSEHGKVLADAAGEVQRGLEVADFAC